VPQSLTKCRRSSAWRPFRVFADKAYLF
jgi:hypothetical protein